MRKKTMPDLCPPIKRLSFSLLMTLTIISLLSSCGEEKDPVALLPPVITAYQPSSAFNNESIVITGENFGTAINDVEVFFFEDARATITAITNTS
ncbi:MAG: IPT/TIG domain-containing protein, partial [Cyclobacteriaceae bacterium]|nr:IPT/TIG domain-containing protein [Cyclobacteriaceae bacterium]